MTATLFAIVEVDHDQRIRCQAPGCGKSVYKRIHVVRDGDRTTVVGSDCWSRIYAASVSKRTPTSGDASRPRLLSAEEREELLQNTAAFIARIEAEMEAERLQQATMAVRAEEEAHRQREEVRRRLDLPLPRRPSSSTVHDRARWSSTPPADNALVRYREAQAAAAVRRAVAGNASFNRFPMRWIERAMKRAKENCVEAGLRLDEPGSREAIEGAALTLLELHYPERKMANPGDESS